MHPAHARGAGANGAHATRTPPGRARPRALALLLLASAGFCLRASAQQQRPAAAYAPLFGAARASCYWQPAQQRGGAPPVGPLPPAAPSTFPLDHGRRRCRRRVVAMIKLGDVPEFASPGSPPLIPAAARRRRAEGYPAAQELSVPPLERVAAGEGEGGARRRQLLHRPAPAGEDAAAARAERQPRGAGTGRRPLQAPPASPLPRRPGWAGLWWADAGGVGVAVGPRHVLHAAGGALAVYARAPGGDAAGAPLRTVALQDFFAPVGAALCRDGVLDGVPLFDKAARRYLLAATCGGKGSALLAASATADPAGAWFLYSLAADGVGTGLACASPRESAVADGVRLGYDAHGVLVSLFSYCPSGGAAGPRGAALLALPKYRVYKGAPNFLYAVFTADQVLAALPAEAREGLTPASFAQCQPAPPQNAADAQGGAAYFVCDHVGPDGPPRRAFTLVGLVNTGALWQFAGAADDSPAPFLTAALVDRGRDAPLSAGVLLQQPGGGSPLHAGGTRPAGFWSGAAVLSRGKVYTVDRVDVRDDAPTLAPTLAPAAVPSLVWAEVEVQPTWTGGGGCGLAATSAWGGRWDWTKDWSQDWGADFDLQWEETRAAAAEVTRAAAAVAGSLREVRIAAVANCSAAAAAARAARRAAGGRAAAALGGARPAGLPGGGGEIAADGGADDGDALEASMGVAACAAEAVAAAAPALGLPAVGRAGRAGRQLRSSVAVASSYADLGCWYCLSSGSLLYDSSWFYRYWYLQTDFSWYSLYKRTYGPGWSRPSKFIGHRRAVLQDASGALPAEPGLAAEPEPAPGPSAAGAGVALPPCLAATQAFKGSCTRCNYSGAAAALAASVARSGVLALASGPRPLGFVAPGIAARPDGSLVVVAGYAGPGGHPGAPDRPAFPGVGAWSVPPPGAGAGGAANASATWRVLRTGVGPVTSRSGRWSEFSSLDFAPPAQEEGGGAGTAAAVADTAAAAAPAQAQLYYGVQWAQRVVDCAPAADGVQRACAMPAPWIGRLLQHGPMAIRVREFGSCSRVSPARVMARGGRTDAPRRAALPVCTTPASTCSTSDRGASPAAARRGRRGVGCRAGARDLPIVAFFGRQADPDLTVAKLQVGVFGQVEEVQRELDRIAGLLDSDDEDAMADLVHDVVVLLTRRAQYCGYAHTALFMTDDLDELEQKYNQASLKERAKFKAETLSNVGGRVVTEALRETGADVGLDKWLCITLLLAAEATVKLPKIRGLQDLQESLTLLGSLPAESIVAVELLWTPQERGDSYAKDELLADYPKLVTLARVRCRGTMLVRRLASTSAGVADGSVYDVAVVGAGMVGAAVAALLRAHPLTAGMRLALIDPQPPPLTLELPPHPDLRVSTITPANMQLLTRAGAWAELEAAGAAPTFEHMQVWEHAGPGFIAWSAADVGQPHMGAVVENRLLQAALLRAAQRAGGGGGGGSGCLDLLVPRGVEGVRLPPAGAAPPTLGDSGGSGGGGGAGSGALAELALSDGSRVRARLVVAADGARSRVRALAGFRTLGWSYAQRGLVASVSTDAPSDTAWQRFLPTGPLALLPARGGFSNVVWSTSPDMAAALERAGPEQFAAAVNDALQSDPASFAAAGDAGGAGAAAPGAALPPLDAAVTAATAVLQHVGGALGSSVLGQLLTPGALDAGAAAGYWRRPPRVEGWVGAAPRSFPLQLQHSGRYVAPRLALVGDAAHAVHPLAGQGVNLGLADAAALADALACARELGADVGEPGALRAAYEAPRQAANLAMMAALELLWRGFGLQAAPAGAARAAGLGLLNGMGPLKNRIMRYAMGFS
ncbi:coq6 [Scenedesmus sp. PABB004]|nr:coq6 [Scenedesmus sp. PABB004]